MKNENATFEQWCHTIRQRLPEILIKLSAWPKGYRNWIPKGLFFEGADWSPQKAIQEIESHLKRLESLALTPQQSFFLSQKILRQIEVLVLLSKQFPAHYEPIMAFKALTREKHKTELEQHQNLLIRQKQALEKRLLKLPNDEFLKKDLQMLQKKLSEIQERLTKV
jgi:hypothetical protein